MSHPTSQGFFSPSANIVAGVIKCGSELILHFSFFPLSMILYFPLHLLLNHFISVSQYQLRGRIKEENNVGCRVEIGQFNLQYSTGKDGNTFDICILVLNGFRGTCLKTIVLAWHVSHKIMANDLSLTCGTKMTISKSEIK